MNRIPFVAGCMLLLSAGSLHAEAMLDLSFENAKDAKHFDQTGAGVRLGSIGDRGCLIVDKAKSEQAFKPIAVKPLTKYKLTLRASVVDSDTIESNDRIADFIEQNGGRGFAECKLNFLDDAGEKTTFLMYGKIKVATPGVNIVSKEFHDYVFVFYSPPGASLLELRIAPRGRDVHVDHLTLEAEQEEGTVNCNPDFRYGSFHAGEWSDGQLYVRPDAQTVMKFGYGGHSSFFAVDDKARYSFECKGVGYHTSSGKVTVAFFDEVGNELGYTHLFWDRDMEKVATKTGIQPLPGAKLAMLKPSRVIVEKVLVTKD
ncbi:hypothetical protein FF011L_27770 [Roseimaritima multifibrata]|uniref:Uncharacterized protein n=1 Tax=Roseimaritima multifibrata TaxID=1930274 RepID=A0A517MGI4_9BACT|nr:hypothetical protein [Roseimaritima multifibrata]QDS94000.1 hypothetical protein FF011L_27770 [Roseimaritima multifibrata]